MAETTNPNGLTRWKVHKTLEWELSATTEQAAIDAAQPYDEGEYTVVSSSAAELMYNDAWLPEPMRAALARIRFAEIGGGKRMKVSEGDHVFVSDGRVMYRVLAGEVGEVDRDVGQYSDSSAPKPEDWERPDSVSDPALEQWPTVHTRHFLVKGATVKVNDAYYRAAEELYRDGTRQALWWVSKTATMIELREGSTVLARIMGMRQ